MSLVCICTVYFINFLFLPAIYDLQHTFMIILTT